MVAVIALLGVPSSTAAADPAGQPIRPVTPLTPGPAPAPPAVTNGALLQVCDRDIPVRCADRALFEVDGIDGPEDYKKAFARTYSCIATKGSSCDDFYYSHTIAGQGGLHPNGGERTRPGKLYVPAQGPTDVILNKVADVLEIPADVARAANIQVPAACTTTADGKQACSEDHLYCRPDSDTPEGYSEGYSDQCLRGLPFVQRASGPTSGGLSLTPEYVVAAFRYALTGIRPDPACRPERCVSLLTADLAFTDSAKQATYDAARDALLKAELALRGLRN